MASKQSSSNSKAVVLIKGHQYVVHPSMKLTVSRMDAKDGETVDLKDIYCVCEGDSVKIGMPIVSGAVVKAKVLKQTRGPKVIAFKYRPKARSRVKKGFRASETELEITEIKS